MQGKVFKQLIKHEEAQEALEDLVKFLGMGFHPDNLAGEYINNTGRTFSETQAKLIDKNLGIIFEAIPDIYEETISLWYKLGMTTTKEL